MAGGLLSGRLLLIAVSNHLTQARAGYGQISFKFLDVIGEGSELGQFAFEVPVGSGEFGDPFGQLSVADPVELVPHGGSKLIALTTESLESWAAVSTGGSSAARRRRRSGVSAVPFVASLKPAALVVGANARPLVHAPVPASARHAFRRGGERPDAVCVEPLVERELATSSEPLPSPAVAVGLAELVHAGGRQRCLVIGPSALATWTYGGGLLRQPV
ncbi:hypothetical protein [Streptomyces hypolithicus]